MILEPKIDPPEPMNPRDLSEIEPFAKEYRWLDPVKLSPEVIKRVICMLGRQIRPVATIELEITEFHSFANQSDDRCGICLINPPKVTANPVAPGNTQNQGRITQYSSDMFRLRISRGSAAGNPRVPLILEFVITSANPLFSYAPVGIFVSDTGMERSFSVASVQGNVIRVINHYVEAPKFWQFMIGVRDTVSGQMGMIDPGIEDTDQPF